MTADRDQLRFLVDESALGLGKTLEAARKDTIHIGHKLIPDCPTGTLDPDWIPRVAARNLTVIGRDKHIRTRPGERQRLREAGLRVFRIGGKRDLDTWDWLDRVVRNWAAMERMLEERPGGPWFYLINQHGPLVEVPLVDEPPVKRVRRANRAQPARNVGDMNQSELFS